MGQSRFERGAATWDENPGRVLVAERVASAVLSRVPVAHETVAVDYGCGTGLVTLALQPYVGRIVGMDSSGAMLSVLRGKADEAGLAGVETLRIDLQTEAVPAIRADLVVSAMTLHHVEDVPKLLGALAGLLTPGGWLCLADLDPEDGTFHPDPSGVYRNGIDREWLKGELLWLGLRGVWDETAHTIERPGPDGVRRYPVFMIGGQTGAR